MPLVYVHGITVRAEGNYFKAEKARDELFRRFALSAVSSEPDRVTIQNIYWGDLGVRFDPERFMPTGGEEFFGGDEELLAVLLAQSLGERPSQPEPEAALLTIARESSLENVIDLLWGASAQTAEDEQQSDLAQLAIQAAGYVHAHPQPDWLSTVANDTQFLSELQFQVQEWSESKGAPGESFGLPEVWEQIKEVGFRVQNAFGSVASRGLLKVRRHSLNQSVGRFIGDVSVYLTGRGTAAAPGPIPLLTIKSLLKARQQVSSADPKLIVVGHSFGGIILYDVLANFLPQLHPDLSVDALVTVGSQVAVFQEMGLLPEPMAVAGTAAKRVARPGNARHWLNVFDENDVLSFATEQVFEGTTDYHYATGAGVLNSHGSYFTLPSFHQRLAARLKELSL